MSLKKLKADLKIKGCEILAILPNDKPEEKFIRMPKTREKIRWTCARNKKHISESLFQNVKKTLDDKTKDEVLCGSCSKSKGKKGKSINYSSIEELKRELSAKGCNILAIIVDAEEIPFERVPLVKEKVKWVCAKNKDHISTSSFSNLRKILVDDSRKEILCRSCAISASKGGPCYDDFVQKLEEEKWVMVSSSKEYGNTKTAVQVKCSTGHLMETNYNRFILGHRCNRCHNEGKRHTIKDVTKEFEEKGFVLLATEYVNNSTDMKYVCKCGREGAITYSNFARNISGCRKCSGRWTTEEVRDFMEDRNCTLLSEPEEFVLNDTEITYTCVCNNEHTSIWRLFKRGARCKVCTKETIKETCLRIYGVDNPSKSEMVKKRMVRTVRKRYGVDYAMQYEEFAKKSVETNKRNHDGIFNLNDPKLREEAASAYIEKYGSHFGTVKEHQEKSKEKCRENLGVDYPFQSKKIHEKIKKGNLDKYGNEVFLASETGKKMIVEKYGSEFFVTSQAMRDQMMEKYGVENAMQNPEILAKALYTAYSSKDFICPSGKVCRVQGYEPFALRDLLEQGVEEDDIVTGCSKVPTVRYEFEGKSRVYFPDIYIKSRDLIIEVKSVYTHQRELEKNNAKFDACALLHNFQLWIYGPKGIIVERREIFFA